MYKLKKQPNEMFCSLGFTDLSLNDQMRLLQSTWAELLTLTTVFRSLEQFDSWSGEESPPDEIISEENGGCGLKLRYAADYWLDEKLARECLMTVDSSTQSNNDSSMVNSLSTVITPSVLDIYNLVSTTN